MPRVLPGMNTTLALPAASGPLGDGQKMTTARKRSSGLCWKGGRGRRSRREELLRVVNVNVNGMNDRGKRKEVVDMVEKGRIDALGVSEIHLKGCGMKDGRDEDEGGL